MRLNVFFPGMHVRLPWMTRQIGYPAMNTRSYHMHMWVLLASFDV